PAAQNVALVVPLRAPNDSEIPAGALGASIRRGLALLAATHDSLPAYAPGKLRCLSCHLDEGRRAKASPFVGVYARYPNYNTRSGHPYTIEDRINDCFVRSLNGRALPAGGTDMRDIVVYFAWMSRGVPVGAAVEGQGLAKLTPLPGDTARGRALFGEQCARCHGADGAGTLGASIVQHWCGHEPAPDGGRIHPLQHAVRSSRFAHRPTGVRCRGLRDVASAPGFR